MWTENVFFRTHNKLKLLYHAKNAGLWTEGSLWQKKDMDLDLDGIHIRRRFGYDMITKKGYDPVFQKKIKLPANLSLILKRP